MTKTLQSGKTHRSSLLPHRSSGRVGILYWRDPAMATNALSDDDYNRMVAREFCCRKATMGLIRRDKNGDYVVAGELSLTGVPPCGMEFEQVTVVPRTLVFKVTYLEEKRARRKRGDLASCGQPQA